MTAAKYDNLRKKLLDHALGVTPLAMPANVKLRLFTTAPSHAGGDGVVVSGGAYADVTVAWNGTLFPASVLASGITASTLASLISFGAASGANWGTITAVDIRDAAGGGGIGLMYFATLDTPVVVNDGNGFFFNTGDLIFNET